METPNFDRIMKIMKVVNVERLAEEIGESRTKLDELKRGNLENIKVGLLNKITEFFK